MLFHRFIGNKNANNLIIFLHEGLGSCDLWKNFPETLVQSLNCYGLVYDRSGYGNSPGTLKNRDIDYLHAAANELHNFIESLNLKHYSITLYGHSDGGSIALIYAAKYPKTVVRIITEAAHAFVEPITLEGVKNAQKPFLEGKFEGLKKYHGERYKEVFWAWNDIWLNPLFERWNILNEIEKIEIPSLIIQGLNDEYGTPKQVSDITKSIGALSHSLLIENAGHAPHKTHSKIIISEIQSLFPTCYE